MPIIHLAKRMAKIHAMACALKGEPWNCKCKHCKYMRTYGYHGVNAREIAAERQAGIDNDPRALPTEIEIKNSRALAYCRESTDHQAKTKLSCDAQIAQVTSYYEAVLKPRGIPWLGYWHDKAQTASREFFRRPEAAKLILHIQPGDHLIIAKTDRGFRNMRDAVNTLHWLSVRRVTVHLASEGQVYTWEDTAEASAGRAYIGMLGIFAELERDRIRHRILDAFAIVRQRYGVLGKPPFGFRIIGPSGWKKYVPDYRVWAVGQLLWMSMRVSPEAVIAQLAHDAGVTWARHHPKSPLDWLKPWKVENVAGRWRRYVWKEHGREATMLGRERLTTLFLRQCINPAVGLVMLDQIRERLGVVQEQLDTNLVIIPKQSEIKHEQSEIKQKQDREPSDNPPGHDDHADKKPGG